MSDRCVQCGKAAVVRRVLPPTDPLGAAGGNQPVCVDCAARLDGTDEDLSKPASENLMRVGAVGAASAGAGLLLVAVAAILLIGAVIAFFRDNWH